MIKTYYIRSINDNVLVSRIPLVDPDPDSDSDISLLRTVFYLYNAYPQRAWQCDHWIVMASGGDSLWDVYPVLWTQHPKLVHHNEVVQEVQLDEDVVNLTLASYTLKQLST